MNPLYLAGAVAIYTACAVTIGFCAVAIVKSFIDLRAIRTAKLFFEDWDQLFKEMKFWLREEKRKHEEDAAILKAKEAAHG